MINNKINKIYTYFLKKINDQMLWEKSTNLYISSSRNGGKIYNIDFDVIVFWLYIVAYMWALL